MCFFRFLKFISSLFLINTRIFKWELNRRFLHHYVCPKKFICKIMEASFVYKRSWKFSAVFSVVKKTSRKPSSCTPVEAGVHPATGFVPNWLGDIDCPPELGLLILMGFFGDTFRENPQMMAACTTTAWVKNPWIYGRYTIYTNKGQRTAVFFKIRNGEKAGEPDPFISLTAGGHLQPPPPS